MKLENKLKKYAKAIGAGIVISAFIYAPRFKQDTYVATVQNCCINYEEFMKDPFSDSHKFKIRTELENGKLKILDNKNSYLRLKGNSQEVQEKIEKGKTYKFKTYGFENSLLQRIYGKQNIISAKQIK